MSTKTKTRNEDNVLFRALTRIFSGPITKRRRQFYTREKKQDLQKYDFNSMSGHPFKTTSKELFAGMTAKLISEQQRSERYSDFDAMVYEPIIASALNLVADEMTTCDLFEEVLKINCQNQQIKSMLHEFFYDILNVNHNLFYWSKMMCKYGDFFLYLDIDDELGVTNVISLPAREIERMEGEDKSNANYVQFQWNSAGLTFENWQVCHFRLMGDDKFGYYGQSFLEPARRIWRQLCVASDQRIWTKERGWETIEKCEQGDTILSFCPDTKKLVETKIKKKAWMGFQEIVELHTANRTVKVTPNHGMLVCDTNGQFLYKRAKDIITSEKSLFECDKLVLPNKWENEKNEHVVKVDDSVYLLDDESRNNPIFANKEFVTTPEFLHLFGFMMKWGWVGTQDAFGFVCTHSSVQNKKKAIIETMKRLFSQEKEDYVSFPKGIGGKYLFYSREVVNVFKQLGFIRNPHDRRIPSWIFTMSKENKIHFVKGLMMCQESPRTDVNLFAYWSEDFIVDLQILCQQAGIKVEKKWSKTRKSRGYTLPGYLENSSNPNSSKVYSKVKKLYVNPLEVNTEDYMLEPAICVKVLKNKTSTYDIEVEHDVHNFTVEGLVSHNTLIEDAMMSYRIVRSPERKVFYLDVGNIPPEDVEKFVRKFIAENKKEQVIDHETGRVDLRFAPLSVSDDYYIPTRGGTNTKIESLPGGQYVGDIEDVKYLQSKLFAALQIPAAYLLTSAEAGAEDRTTLSQKDVRFARTVQRLQKYVICELEKMAQIHLYVLGFRGDDLINFSLALANPSKISALQELELWRTKFDVASAATTGHFSKRWVHTKMLGLSEEEFLRNQREIVNDRKYELMLERISQGEQEEAPGGGGGFGGGGDFGGEDVVGDVGSDTLEGGDSGEVQEEAPSDDETLLAQPEAPGKRDDGYTRVLVKKPFATGEVQARLTPGSKGKWYEPEKHDSRTSSGPRRQQTDSLTNQRMSKNVTSNIFGRGLKNKARDHIKLGFGITEQEQYGIISENKVQNDIYSLENEVNQINEQMENLLRNEDSEEKTQ